MIKLKRIHQRQRQKTSRRTLVIIGAVALVLLVSGLTVFFSISHVEHTKAVDQNERINILIVPEQNFTTELEIAAPEMAEQTVPANTVLAKKTKAIPASEINPTSSY